MLLYLELRRWIVTAWQVIVPRRHLTPILLCCPFSSYRLFPHLLQDLAQKPRGRTPTVLSSPSCFCCKDHDILEILKQKCSSDSSKAQPAGSESQIHPRELLSPCSSPNSHLHHLVMWNARSSIAHFLEAVCLRTWVKLLFLPQRTEWAFLPSRVLYSCEVPNHFWREFGDLVPGPYSQITIITISRRTRVLALLTAAKCCTQVGFAVVNVTFTMGFATWKSIICFPGTYAW